MTNHWTKTGDGYVYTDWLPTGCAVQLARNGETQKGTPVYRIATITPAGGFRPYLVFYDGVTERTQWTLTTAKQKAEYWIEEHLTK